MSLFICTKGLSLINILTEKKCQLNVRGNCVLNMSKCHYLYIQKV